MQKVGCGCLWMPAALRGRWAGGCIRGAPAPENVRSFAVVNVKWLGRGETLCARKTYPNGMASVECQETQTWLGLTVASTRNGCAYDTPTGPDGAAYFPSDQLFGPAERGTARAREGGREGTETDEQRR